MTILELFESKMGQDWSGLITNGNSVRSITGSDSTSFTLDDDSVVLFSSTSWSEQPKSDDDVTRETIQAMKVLGVNILDEFSLKNVNRGYTSTQVRQIASDMGIIFTLLMSGALPSAKEEVQNTSPTAEVLQADLDEIEASLIAIVG